MDQNAMPRHRPLALWVIVVSFSSLVCLNVAVQIYLRFWSSHRHTMAARYADWSLLDYAERFYPGLMIVVGCIGLVMLRRWALYVFGLLLLLRAWEVISIPLRDGFPESSGFLSLTVVARIIPPAIGCLYVWHLHRSGMLRKGVW